MLTGRQKLDAVVAREVAVRAQGEQLLRADGFYRPSHNRAAGFRYLRAARRLREYRRTLLFPWAQ